MSEKKSVSIIGPSSRFLSGISYYTVYLSNALSKEYEVNVVLFRKMLPTFLFPGAARVGADLSNLSYEPKIHVTECVDWYNPFSWYNGYVSASKSDECVFEWWTSSVAHMYLFIGLLLRCRKIPIILEFHEVVDTLEEAILPIRLYSKVMGKLIRKLSTKYIVHSTQDRDLVSERYQIPSKSIQVIPLGLYDQYPRVDKSDAKMRLGISTEHVVLFFGLLRPYKGVKYLVQAFEKLPEDLKKNTTLLIVGEPWEDQDSLTAARTSDDKSHIKLFSEYVSDSDVPDYFSASDILTLPYTRASQSAVALIGIAYGMPIVASRVGGLIDSLGTYDGTVFVSPKNVSELSIALEDTLTKNHPHYSVPVSLDWDHIVTLWHDVIEK